MKVIRNCILLFLLVIIGLYGCTTASNLLTVDEQLENGELIFRSTAFEDDLVLTGSESIELLEDSPVAITARGNTGYAFSAWKGIDAEYSPAFFNINEDIIIGAEFKEAQYKIAVDEPANGSLTVIPEVVNGDEYPANSSYSLKAVPQAGYVVDSVFAGNSGPILNRYEESMTGELRVDLSSRLRFGAYFIEESELEGFTVKQNIVYAKPGVKPLRYDVYIPDGAENLPLVVIMHGGGWSANDEDVMRGMAREIARSGRYVAVSIDYRWLGQLDGDPVPNTVADIICDVYGALAHIQEHAAEYHADPTRIAVTGDSAGGHLSASAATMIELIGDSGFGVKRGVYEYTPSYIPEGKTAEDVKESLLVAIRAAAPSYGVFDSVKLNGRLENMTEKEISLVCPIDNIPPVSERVIPHYLIRGKNDTLISDRDVQVYADALNAAGQTVEYIQIDGIGHSFLDWKPVPRTVKTFGEFGVPNIRRMVEFFDRYM